MKYILIITFFLLAYTADKGHYYIANQKKADKSFSKIWEDGAPTLSFLAFTKAELDKADVKNVELYKLISSTKQDMGFVYFTEAPSKVETFTYMIIFNPDLSIMHTEVLKYKENYGAEICSKRFLKQFIGKKNGLNLEFEQDIDGISGATISSRSIIRGVKIASRNIVKLKENNLI